LLEKVARADSALLDTVSLIREKEKKRSAVEDRRSESEKKRQDLLSKVSRTLKGAEPLRVILEKVLGHIFHHLTRLDRGAFVLVDPETLRAMGTLCTDNKST
jgi:hypothetical protein